MLPLGLRDYEKFPPGPPTTFLGTRCTCLGKFARVCDKSTSVSFGEIRTHLGEYRVGWVEGEDEWDVGGVASAWLFAHGCSGGVGDWVERGACCDLCVLCEMKEVIIKKLN